MNVQKDKSSRLAKHLDNVQRIAPALFKHFAHPLQMLIEHVLLEIRYFVRQFRAGEVEQEWTSHQRHFDGAQLSILIDKQWHVMAGDVLNSFVAQKMVNFQLAVKAVQAVEELNGCKSIGAKDESILTRSRAESFEQPARMTRFVFGYSRIIHADIR